MWSCACVCALFVMRNLSTKWANCNHIIYVCVRCVCARLDRYVRDDDDPHTHTHTHTHTHLHTHK